MEDQEIINEGEKVEARPNTSIQVYDVGVGNYERAIAPARANLAALRQYVRDEFREGVDYGAPFPGSDKSALLLPGAEKFNLLFSARPEFVPIQTVTDTKTGFCHYHIGCRLVHKGTDVVIGYGEGSCNSYESSFRYRMSERTCPNCGKNTIIKGREEYGGGWLCYGKKGGCGAKFADDDPAIVNQEVGRVENDNLFDIWNTVLKKAEKRALVAAVVYTGGVSELFTQDSDDFLENESAKPRSPKPKPQPRQAPIEKKTVKLADGRDVPADGKIDAKTARAIMGKFVGNDKPIATPALMKNHLRAHFSVDALGEMTWEKAIALTRHLKGEGDDPRYYPAEKPPAAPPPAGGVNLDEIAAKAFGVKHDDLDEGQKARIAAALKIVEDGGLEYNPDVVAELSKMGEG